jgi:tetratricopeptide (TPR) repeat protein
MLQVDLKEYDAAIETFRGAVEAQERLTRLKPDDAQFVFVLALLHESYGLALFRAGRGDDAVAQMERATDLFGRIVALFPAAGEFCRHAAQCHGLFSSMLGERRDWPRAVREAQTATGILQNLIIAWPEYRNPPVELAGARCRLAEALVKCDRRAEAVEEFRAAIQAAEQPTGQLQAEAARKVLAEALVGLGEALIAGADVEAALAAFDRGLKAAGPDATKLLNRAHAGRAVALTALGRHAEAREARDAARRFTASE